MSTISSSLGTRSREAHLCSHLTMYWAHCLANGWMFSVRALTARSKRTEGVGAFMVFPFGKEGFCSPLSGCSLAVERVVAGGVVAFAEDGKGGLLVFVVVVGVEVAFGVGEDADLG